jgi:hypothetical protein
MFHLERGQSTQTYDDLRITAQLAPGQMLMIGPREEPLCSLGRVLLSDHKGEKPTEKLIVIRLASTSGDAPLP